MGDALSEEAEREFYRTEKRREQWLVPLPLLSGLRCSYESDGWCGVVHCREMEQYMEGEMEEMVQEYVKKDVSEADARTILVRHYLPPPPFLLLNFVVVVGMLWCAEYNGEVPRSVPRSHDVHGMCSRALTVEGEGCADLYCVLLLCRS
jgi:hypothetical protein